VLAEYGELSLDHFYQKIFSDTEGVDQQLVFFLFLFQTTKSLHYPQLDKHSNHDIISTATSSNCFAVHGNVSLDHFYQASFFH
jgi:hypothetical protein